MYIEICVSFVRPTVQNQKRSNLLRKNMENESNISHLRSWKLNLLFMIYIYIIYDQNSFLRFWLCIRVKVVDLRAQEIVVDHLCKIIGAKFKL